MANVIIDVAAEFTGKKAFKDAGNATSTLEKSVKTLGKTIGLTFSAKAIVDFSKASVKAFAEDDRAIRVLRTNLKNLGLAYQSANADNFIKNMETQAAVSDDLLRPAYAQLAKVTLSTTKTQDLMALAFDLSAANGIDFASTVDILSNAYVGNYKGLKQLYTGLTQAQLASKSFEEIQAILTKQSKGAGKVALDTYAGSVDKLSIAADNAKESIGKGLVDLFANLAGNGDIDQATANINTFSDALGQMLSDAAKYGALDWLSAFVTGNVTESTAQKLVKRPSARRFFTGGSGVSSDLLTARREAAAEAARLKAIKAAAAAKIKADKLAAANKLKLDKAASIFNMQSIQINAALKGKITEEEKTRLLLLQAIADEDADKAEILSKKLEEIQKKNEAIAKSLLEIGQAKDPFSTWSTSLTAALLELNKVGERMFAIRQRESGFVDTSILGGGGVGGTTGGTTFPANATPAEIVAIVETAVVAAETAVAEAAASVEATQTNTEALAASADAALTLATEMSVAADIADQSQTSSIYNPYGGMNNQTIAAAQAATLLAAGSNAGAGTSSSMFNPYATTPGSSAGFGTQGNFTYPPITINIEGMIDTDNFEGVMNQAMLNAIRKGLPQSVAGQLT
jgi:hypothetical protein